MLHIRFPTRARGLTCGLAALLTVAVVMASVGMFCVGVWLLLGARLRALINSPQRLKWFNGTMAASLVLLRL